MAVTGAKIVKALNHPYRRVILRVLLEEEGKLASPSQIAKPAGARVALIAYHMNILAD